MSITSVIPSNDELESLRRVAGLAKCEPMSGTHRESLLRAGFVAFQSGALAVTIMGRAKLVLEITRTSWVPGRG